jgi:hypothetical protein
MNIDDSGVYDIILYVSTERKEFMKLRWIKEHPFYSLLIAFPAVIVLAWIFVPKLENPPASTKRLNQLSERCEDETGHDLIRATVGGTAKFDNKSVVEFTSEGEIPKLDGVEQNASHEVQQTVTLRRVEEASSPKERGSVRFVYFAVSPPAEGTLIEAPFAGRSGQRIWTVVYGSTPPQPDQEIRGPAGAVHICFSPAHK